VLLDEQTLKRKIDHWPVPLLCGRIAVLTELDGNGTSPNPTPAVAGPAPGKSVAHVAGTDVAGSDVADVVLLVVDEVLLLDVELLIGVVVPLPRLHAMSVTMRTHNPIKQEMSLSRRCSMHGPKFRLLRIGLLAPFKMVPYGSFEIKERRQGNFCG
jgi:hypothetical protein